MLRELGLEFRVHVTSAHRTPQRTVELVRAAEQDGCQVFICAAGMAAHLAGVVAAHTLRPVLGVPLPGGVLDGVDALLSTVQMPGGMPVATFAVGSAGARNAAFFAAQMVAARAAGGARRAGAARRQPVPSKVVAADREIVDAGWAGAGMAESGQASPGRVPCPVANRSSRTGSRWWSIPTCRRCPVGSARSSCAHGDRCVVETADGLFLGQRDRCSRRRWSGSPEPTAGGSSAWPRTTTATRISDLEHLEREIVAYLRRRTRSSASSCGRSRCGCR